MRRGVRHLGLIVAVAVFGSAAVGANALAGGSDGSWEVGAYGYEIFPDVSSGIQNSLGYGVRAGYNLKATSEIELTWDKSKGDAILASGPSFDIKKIGLMFVRNFVPKGKKTAVPTFVFGLGNVSIDSGAASESSYYLRLGGGARFYVAPHVAIRLEAGILRWRGQGDATPQSADYSFDANLGVSFVFGGKGAGPGGDSTGDKKDSKKEGESGPKGEKGEIP